MAIAPPGGTRRPAVQEVVALELVSGLLIIIGLAAFGFLFYSIATNSDIRDATQGLDVEGIGVEVVKIPPQPVFDQAHFSLALAADSAAEALGFQNEDIILKIGDTDLDAARMTADDLADIYETVLTEAQNAEQAEIAVVVLRGASTVTVTVPVAEFAALFGSDADMGLNVEFVPAPYFELRPIEGGQAVDAGVQRGDRLLKVEDRDITPDMTIQDVRELLAEEDLPREDDDFEIAIEFLRVAEDGSTASLERSVLKDVPPSATLAYLENFGFVMPVILILFGLGVIRMGVRLRQYQVIAARWAMVTFLWLSVGLITVAFWQFWVQGKGGLVTDEPFDWTKGLSNGIPYLIAIIPLAASYRWLTAVEIELFGGDESLTSRNTRFAWTLLIPTLVVLALIAARPLEQTFIKSLTDDEFGTHRPARYVGFRNYENLVSLRFATVDCRTDDATGDCQTTADGSTIVWERSSLEDEEMQKVREMTSEERQKYVRYREATTMKISGTRGLRILAKDPDFLKATANTLRFTFSSVVLELILGMVIALVVHSNFPGRGLMRTAMLVPWAIPTVVSAVLWQTMMRGDQTGIFNKLLIDLGLLDQPEQWFAVSGSWMNSIIAVDVWKTSPFMALLILAGLQTIPADIYEAASVDGASKTRQFFRITLPLLRPTIAVALIFRTLDALRAFDVFQVLLDTTRPSMASYNYYQLVQSRADGYASAVGVLIFILILVFTVVYVRFVGIEQE